MFITAVRVILSYLCHAQQNENYSLLKQKKIHKRDNNP